VGTLQTQDYVSRLDEPVIERHNLVLGEEFHREYERRIAHLREILHEEGLDGVIVSDRRYNPENPTSMTTHAYARYLSNMTLYGGGGGGGHHANRSNPIVVASRHRDPIMVLPPGLRNTWPSYARHRSWIVDVKCSGENRVFQSQGDFPSNSGVIEFEDIASAIRESGLEKGRIGVAGNWPQMERTYAAFPSAEFVPVVQKTPDGKSRDLLKPLIISNSPWGIARLEKAQVAANAAIAALRSAAKAGASVREAGIEAKAAGLRAGAHEISVDGSVIAEPWTFAWYDTAPDHLRFEPGKLYTIEIAYCMVDGHCVQTAGCSRSASPSRKCAVCTRRP
jgi:Xaa-Pro aminopeptidase